MAAYAADTKVRPYAQSLQKLTECVGTRDSKWLHLPDGCSWPGRLQHKEPIMIRPSYIVAMHLLDDRFGLAPADEAAAGAGAGTSGTAGTKTAASGIHWAVIITGQPGIGKSSLGYVYAQVLAKRNKVFIWDYLEEGGIRVRLRFNFRGVGPLLEVGAATAFTGEGHAGQVMVERVLPSLLKVMYTPGVNDVAAASMQDIQRHNTFARPAVRCSLCMTMMCCAPVCILCTLHACVRT